MLVPALVVALLGVVVLQARAARPDLQVYAAVDVAEASAGLVYAVDEQLCVLADGGAEVREVRGTGTADGLTTQVALAPEGVPVIAFPVDEQEQRPVQDAEVQDGFLCLRLLLSAEEQGRYAAPPLEVVVAYGPGRFLTRTFDVTPPSTLEVVRTGPDPRLEGSS